MKKAKTSHPRCNSKNEVINSKPKDIRIRTFEFAVRIVKLVGFLKKRNLSHSTLMDQTMRSGTSIGANLEEAFAAESKRDFMHKCRVALKEARECNYWIRIHIATSNCPANILQGLRELESESIQIAKIIAQMVINTHRKLKENRSRS